MKTKSKKKSKKKSSRKKSLFPRLGEYRLGVIGCGSMAEALVSGLLKAKIFSAKNIFVANRSLDKLSAFAKKYKVNRVSNNYMLLHKSNILLLCVKPKDIIAVGAELRSALRKKHLLISIAAGTSIHTLRKAFGPQARLIRAMPNTPAFVGLGVTGLFADENAKPADLSLAEQIFSGVGITEIVKSEAMMDVITALSGSGPAYVYYFIESMVQAATAAGLNEAAALKLVNQTVLGAASLLKQSGEKPQDLRRKVSSPGGTTIEGVKSLEEGLFVQTVQNAVKAAERRAREMARN